MNEMKELYLDDLHVGQRFNSGSYVMEAARIREFAAEFDPQPFHLDEAAANGADRVRIRAPSSSSRESVEYSHRLNEEECMEIYKACNDCDLSFEPVHKFLSKRL